MGEPGRVRCGDCGFLGKVLQAHPQVILEAPNNERATGRMWQGNNQSAYPWCLKVQFGFLDEIAEIQTTTAHNSQYEDRTERTRTALHRERECPTWFRYEPFHTPPEHLRMESEMTLEEERRKWQTDMEENNRLWDQKLENDRKDWEIRLSDQTERWQKSLRKEARIWQALTVVVAIVGVAVAIAVGN